MKSLATFVFLFIIQSNVWAQVEVESVAANSVAVDSTIAVDHDKVDLHINISPGEAYFYSISTKQNMVQEIMGDTLEINQNFTFDYKYLVESIEGELIKIKATKERIQLLIDSPEEQIVYNSEEEDSDARFAMLKDLIGKPFHVFMNANGKVVKVSGYEELSKELNAGAFISKILTDSSLINSLNMDIYSGQPVTMGESWNKIHEMNVANLQLNNNLTYTLEGTSEDYVWLNVSGNISGAGDHENYEIDLHGTQTGTIESDFKSGMISHGELKMEIDATIKSIDIEIPLKLISETTISGRRL